MAPKRKRKKTNLLSHTRPPTASQKPSLSSQATRSLIRRHHTLQKQLQTAISKGDILTAASVRTQLAASGGLQKYQEASIQGQSAERGGDTSKVLMEWMNQMSLGGCSADSVRSSKLSMLEVGALKIDNACSRSGIFDVTRIDLHSQHPDIQRKDFMEMPVPFKKTLEKNMFDIVSLSLVVNYVGDAVGRGDMLKRVSSFLRSNQEPEEADKIINPTLPALFLVLPAPCVMNSRYLDEERLEAIMTSLGYAKTRRKLSKKLVYYLWRFEGAHAIKRQNIVFKKQEIRPGRQKNNFTIILQ